METARRVVSEFRDFLDKSPENFKDYAKLFFLVLFLSLCWVNIAGLLMSWIVPGSSLTHYISVGLIYLTAAGGEEALFRWLPLALIMLFSRQKPVGLMVLCAVVTSTVFGLAHIHNYPPTISLGWTVFCVLLIQGWLGFVWSLVFIKCCTKRSMFQLSALAMTTLIHFSYNMVVIYGLGG